MKQLRWLLILGSVALAGCVRDTTVAREFRRFHDSSGLEYVDYIRKDAALTPEERKLKVTYLNRMNSLACKITGDPFTPIMIEGAP